MCSKITNHFPSIYVLIPRYIVSNLATFSHFGPVRFWSRNRAPPNSVCIRHSLAPTLCSKHRRSQDFWLGGAQILKNSVVFTEIESDFSAEIGNSNDFFAPKIRWSPKKKKKKGLHRNWKRFLLYRLITVMCAITEKKLQLNIVRLCCHNFLSLVEFWLGGARAPWAPPWLRLWFKV